MTTIFAYDAVNHNPAFGMGVLAAPRKLTRSEKAVLDAAWNTGWTAAAEGGLNVQPPASFTDAEAAAFLAAVDSFHAGAWDDADEKAEAAIFMDAVASGFWHA